MNLRVAQRARLILGVLVVERRRTRRRPVAVWRMTPQAEEVHVIHLQHARVRRPVGRVAIQTAVFGFHRSVFEDEWPHRIGVAFGANRKLTSRSPDLMSDLRAMRIVAVAALNQSGINAMPVGSGEFGLL